MLKLKKAHETPPGGYRFHDDELDMDTQANTKAQLILQCKKLRRLNGVEIPGDFADIIEDWICQRIDQHFVLGEKPPSAIRAYMPLSVVKTATEIFLTQWRIAGRKYVSTAKADERAVICLSCEQNRVNAACLGCKGLTPWVRGWTQRSTTYDQRLLICNCCAVMNVAHIHADNAYIVKATHAEILNAMPATCWRKQLCEVTQ
jgi:hypothetical protein